MALQAIMQNEVEEPAARVASVVALATSDARKDGRQLVVQIPRGRDSQ